MAPFQYDWGLSCAKGRLWEEVGEYGTVCESDRLPTVREDSGTEATD